MESSYLGCSGLHVQFYDRTEPTLTNINLSVRKGEKVLFLGPSGSGKSTFIHVLSGLIPDAILARMKGKVWGPKQRGVLFQDPESQFCMLTVDEEIAFSLENREIPANQMPEIIQKVKEQVGLGHLKGDTPINSLSGGMNQRLALATILALEPEVLFLDEPTAQLDPMGTKEVIDVLKQLDRNQTVLLVEHKLEGILDWIDRVVLFNDQGEVIADGNPHTIYKEYESLIKQYGIWKPRLWPLTWDALLKKECSDVTHSWKKINLPKPSSSEPLITVSNGTLCLKNNMVWSNVNVEITKGDWVAIMGPNGAGKSSFLKTIMGLYTLQEGSITYHFFKKPQRKTIKPEMLSNHIGFVFQNPEHQFVTDSVEDEISFVGQVEKWSEKETLERVEQLIQEFRLSDLRTANPYTLSMGQKRRLSVASMLLKKHELLLMDEPTFGQDAKMTDELAKRMRALNEMETTIVMTTHDVEFAYQYATKLIVLTEGGLLFAGLPEEFFSNSSFMKRAKLHAPLYMEYVKRKRALEKGVTLS
ncbi:ABC transporter ATP-binding protein [Bacillus sp. V3B]|uniref:ABC transporter ATP-binding protein n=1 Tax=Bacillus sp. V3B TaxID=2804915 RepID=UPI00210DEB05|nr:ABC transporter ATP-binding protein [Bacillus sp. V3B]MCQ6275571.1 ABC transporter ATP-binding protein [Bacillus sp. V3B]